MKKMIAMTLVLCMAVSLLAGCGSSKQPETTQPSAEAVPASALEILETVWGKYTEDEKFSISGGNVESNVSDAPGSYDMTYAENMTYDLLVPADQIQNITEAASMTHMMNANSFTCGVFKLAEGVTAGDFGKVMQSAILRSVCKQQCHTPSLHFSVFFILTRQLKLPGISRQNLLQMRQLKRMPQLFACLRTGKLFHDLFYRTGIASFLRKVKICGCPQHTVLIKQGITVQAV